MDRADLVTGVTAGTGSGITRRAALRRVGTAGLAAAAASPVRLAWGQQKAPIKVSFWTFDNPQQRPWVHKRVNLFMEKNPHVKVDFQWFTFADLGKKISVGFATGTAPEGFVSQDWFMPTWYAKNLLAPLDVQRLGYSSVDAFRNDHAPAFVAGAVKDGKVYGYPLWFYGYCNYLNTKQFREVGLDPERDAPKTWEQLGEEAKRLTIKQGDKFVRQGFKFAMHAAQWTMIQFNPILIQCGGSWFDKDGKCTLNNEAGVKAMTIRASIARKYGAEDPADSIATFPLPQMDWLKERASMFSCHPIPPAAIKSQNPTMEAEHYYKPVQLPGVVAGKGYSTCYGFNLVINGSAPKEKQEVLHDMYRFMMSDLVDCWKDTVLTTNNTMLFATAALGADGILSGSGSVVADLHFELFEAVQRGDLHAARRINDRIWVLTQIFYGDPLVNMHNRMKVALESLGRQPRAVVRPPLQPLGAEERARIVAGVREAGLA